VRRSLSRAACHMDELNRDPEIMVHALQAAYDLLDEAAGGLQVIREEHANVAGETTEEAS
jgi:hypothetical protein